MLNLDESRQAVDIDDHMKDYDEKTFTDGGVDSGVGVGAHVTYGEGKTIISDPRAEVVYGRCSSFRAERLALRNALLDYLQRGVKGKNLIIYTDSMSNVS